MRELAESMWILCARVPVKFILLSLVFVLPLSFCLSRDTITLNKPISDQKNETLVSANGSFELGFFTPDGSSSARRYVGIWYHGYHPLTIVWVANRDKPLSIGTGFFGLAEDGNIAAWDSTQQHIWSSGLKREDSFNRTIRLADTGNLVLSNVGKSEALWQSFENPTDTFIPGMPWKENLKLTSWNAPDDPKLGNFTFLVDPDRVGQYMIRKRGSSLPYWKSGAYAKLPDTDNMISNVSCLLGSSCSISNNSQVPRSPKIDYKAIKLGRSFFNNTRLVLNSMGQIQLYRWDNASASWNLDWYQPRDVCSIYWYCGPHAICNSENSMTCQCLPGFEPAEPEQWRSRGFSAGCQRKGDICNSKEFTSLEKMTAENPEENDAKSEEDCKEICCNSCLCEAYYYYYQVPSQYFRVNSPSTACWTWSNGVNNILGQTEDRYKLNVRVASAVTEVGTPMPSKRSTPNKKPLYVIALAVTAILIFLVGLYYYKRRRPENENVEHIQENPVFRLYDREQRMKEWISSNQFNEEDKKGIEVPFFDFEVILAATNNFSKENKLGQGGFGPVYKGTFPGGQEIAIKRLSSASGQGLEEFKIEVMLIAKLQHRNLVRLLGYCIEGEEKILLYEYMPNGSLDSFIFDRTRCLLLTWELRFQIILGIARGMLYLHQDSRLRIIHRDMKSSNVLLDEEMYPKISDFGLARIFESKQTEATTKRVIGTYGYMSPEYALDGFFSFKSDVFSYGVVVLEIISGKRNTAFYQSIGKLNLISHAWKFWSENNALNLMDHALLEACNTSEVFKCINVALLCVQEDPIDRPSMSNVLFMLASESASLPAPKKPGFAVNRSLSTTSSSSKPETICEISTTVVQGR